MLKQLWTTIKSDHCHIRKLLVLQELRDPFLPATRFKWQAGVHRVDLYQGRWKPRLSQPIIVAGPWQHQKIEEQSCRPKIDHLWSKLAHPAITPQVAISPELLMKLQTHKPLVPWVELYLLPPLITMIVNSRKSWCKRITKNSTVPSSSSNIFSSISSIRLSILPETKITNTRRPTSTEVTLLGKNSAKTECASNFLEY